MGGNPNPSTFFMRHKCFQKFKAKMMILTSGKVILKTTKKKHAHRKPRKFSYHSIF